MTLRRIFNEYILPVVYSSEIWDLNTTIVNVLIVAQQKMEGNMLGITFERQENQCLDFDSTQEPTAS